MATTIFTPSMLRGAGTRGIPEIPAGSTPPSFNNIYSLAFDGVDDIVESTFTGNINSLSLWFKPNSVVTTTSSKMVLVSFTDVFPRAGIYLGSSYGALSNELISVGSNTASRISYYAQAGGTITADWHHLAISYTGTQYNIYLDNVNVFTGNIYNEDVSIITASRFDIGARILSGSPDSVFDGNIDEVSVFNYELTAENVASIYNSGVPNNLDDLTTPPVVWYRNGDNGSYKSPQWLIPENSNVANSRISNYSFSFDGVDDIISMGDVLDFDYNQPFTISAWINLEAFTYSFAGVVSKQEGSGDFRGYFLHIDETSGVYNLKFILGNTLSNRIRIQGTTDLLGLGWTHIACTYDGSTNASGTKLYINGSLETLNAGLTQDTLGSNTTLNSASFNIGSRGGSRFFEGNIDEVSVFNSELSATDINSLYGGGTPSTITGAVAHWKMGEEANFTDNWLVNNSALSNYSTRSFNFDGVDDYINTGTNSLIGASTLTISAWFKSSDVDFQYLLGDNSVRFSIKQSNGDTRISFTGSTTPFRGFGVPYNIGEWNNIILTFDGSLVQADRLKLYHNGVEINNINAGTPNTTLLLNTAASFMIGRAGSTSLNPWSGNIDEVAYWDSVQNASTIYNSGTPADLTSLSPLSWWRMGEDSTFNTNWNVPDNAGSNTGTSANMTIADLEGEAPNYTGGGLSANMTIEDRVGDAPNSTSNAVSFNMTEADRETNVPT